jgi:hypothetical protein
MTRSLFYLRYLVPALALSLVGCGSKKDEAPAAPPQTEAQPAAPAKPKITKLDDLPRHTYPVTGDVSDLVTSPEKFAPLAAQVRTDTENDLANFDIEDKTTLKALKGTLLTLDLLEGKNAEARGLIAAIRALEDKPALKLTSGFIAETRLDVEDKTGTTNLADSAFQQAFEKELAARAAAMPWNVIQDELKGAKASYEIRSRNLLLGVIQNEIAPAVQKTGSLDDSMAGSIIGIRSALEIALPLKAPIVAALGSVIDAHKNESAPKPDIWKDRAVTLTEDQKLTPVVVGIWDSGVDPAVYPHQLFTDTTSAAAPLPDNAHGLSFDLHSNPVAGNLYPLGDAANRLPELKSQIKGILDIEAAVDSPEAAALKTKLGALTQDQVKPLLEDLGLFGNYIHGTHVAGIATEGNPAAKILIARLTFDYHLMPEKPTVEQAQKDAAADQAYVDYFKSHGVRVVNMSWGGSLSEVDDALAKNGVGDAAERKKEAREIFDIGKNGLLNALKSAPDILFVTAAGNSNNDVNFDEVIPSSFNLPNMITVGAVDQAGDETSFTSFGNNVFAYADGFEVDSNIPGGSRLKLSGTSMASPAVANLAAKLFALDPNLKPADVLELIKDGLDPAPSDKRILLLNPKKSVELLQERLAGKSSGA